VSLHDEGPAAAEAGDRTAPPDPLMRLLSQAAAAADEDPAVQAWFRALAAEGESACATKN